MPTDFIALFSVLAAARIRFVVVGGLAVLLHGLDRLTADVDLIIDLSTDAAQDAVRALTEAGYRPLAPVDPTWLADPDRRSEWQTQRGMQVFSFWDSTHTRPTVDVMLAPAVPFEELWAEAVVVPIAGTEVRVASIPHLVRLKQAAGRPQDLADIERRRALLLAREWTRPMYDFDPNRVPEAWGTFEDAEALRRWSFLQRTPEQRLAWLAAALELAYQSGALKPQRPDVASSTD